VMGGMAIARVPYGKNLRFVRRDMAEGGRSEIAVRFGTMAGLHGVLLAAVVRLPGIVALVVARAAGYLDDVKA